MRNSYFSSYFCVVSLLLVLLIKLRKFYFEKCAHSMCGRCMNSTRYSSLLKLKLMKHCFAASQPTSKTYEEIVSFLCELQFKQKYLFKKKKKKINLRSLESEIRLN